MFSEDELLPLSALQHLVFCERQAALIHLEGVWAENALTLQGRHLHKRVEGKARLVETRDDLRVTRGLPLRSFALGLVGKADVVEFHRKGEGGVAVLGAAGTWDVKPIEYKRGSPKRNACDRVQLCAQALCLAEMLGCAVSSGALFYGRTRRRLDVVFDKDQRHETEAAAAALHEMMRRRVTPSPVLSGKCHRCSLARECMPEVAHRDTTTRYLKRHVWESLL
jgi:CRISPR-associated exonuclease Cas4